jgi:hypothetical protein
MTRDDNRDWDSVFASVEKDAGITLNEEIRKRIIEAYHSYMDVNGRPRVSSKQLARKRKSMERLRDWFDNSVDHVEVTRCLDALVKVIKIKRGRRPDEAIDGLLAELKRCYEAAGGHVTFRKNDVRQSVAGPYADFLRAIRCHVFQGKVLASDEAFIERARRAPSFIRKPDQPRPATQLKEFLDSRVSKLFLPSDDSIQQWLRLFESMATEHLLSCPNSSASTLTISPSATLIRQFNILSARRRGRA